MTNKDKIDLKERVEAGAALLDRVDPEWRRRADYDKLDMEAQGYDIIGLLYETYITGLNILGVPLDNYSDSKLGFDAVKISDTSFTWEEVKEEYEALTQEWKAQIKGVDQ